MSDHSFDHVHFSIQDKNKDKIKTEIDYDSHSIDEQKAIRFGEDTKHRKTLIIWTMIIISCWLSAVVGLLIVVMIKIGLSDTVLCMLLGTTTINVLGLAKIILSNLFPRFGSKGKKK